MPGCGNRRSNLGRSYRHAARTLWEVGAFTNLRLLAVVVVSLLVQLAISTLPLTARLFQLEQLTPGHLALSVLLGLVPVTVIEINKLVHRALRRSRGHARCTAGPS